VYQLRYIWKKQSGVHSSRKGAGTHVKSWLKFAKSIELVRCMMAMEAADIRATNGKEQRTHEGSPRRKGPILSCG
jgi:hypothetical protein